MAAPSGKWVGVEIRKLRKKLRQIENLERVDRTLSDEEIDKVLNKHVLRDRLQKLLCTEQGQQYDSRIHSTESEMDASVSMTSEWSAPTDSSEVDISLEEDTSVYEVNTNQSANNSLSQIEEQSNLEQKVVEDMTNSAQVLPDVLNFKSNEPVIKTNKPLSEKTSPKHKETVPPDQLKVTRQKWLQSHCVISELIGHNDIITSLFVHGNILLSASRDTTVKVWNLKEGKELRSLGGHTGSVTCVMLLTDAASLVYAEAHNLNTSGQLVLSGSVDCSFKIWNILSGEIIESVYTFNPITKLALLEDKMIITGTDGGKLELWDLLECSNKQSARVHNEAITGLKVRGDHVFSSSGDGVIKVHVVHNWKLSCVFVSENVKSTSGSCLTPRNIHSFDVDDNKILFGDDAINIKLLDWKKGVARKLPNHVDDFASTDALCCVNKLLISSSYNLDIGIGYINIRSLPRGDYLASLDDENTERIICLACTKLESGKTVVISGGAELKLWHILSDRTEDEDVSVIQPRYISRLARPGQDSDLESETEFSDEEHDVNEDDDDDVTRENKTHDSSQSQTWLSWCCLL